MNKNIDYEQLENISSSLLKGFISWIEINDSQERAMILDSAYQFKFSILEQDKSTVQKKYFISPKDLSKDEASLLLNQWKDTFSQIINSDLDRISKDSFKLWFLSLASFLMPISTDLSCAKSLFTTYTKCFLFILNNDSSGIRIELGTCFKNISNFINNPGLISCLLLSSKE